ncbi:STAS domain-containing protein [Pseudoxanthomonas sangjuensis]|uniref:STAS domain-containing protein n=1 Tax=Pseudoxanthomonas sangjuensis TaxID=1503750 RepID=UPI0013912566|nr:STAS domain-containing protein [Pseudoxanthomonas sangjuensis]KAF1708094.1 anti-sigma F factor antagonist [Pseudoxanthomonas sangjuensis]
MDFEIDIYPPVNGNHYVVLSGRLDSAGHARLDAALAPLLADATPAMVLVMDMARVDYISSAGVRSILLARKRLAPEGRVLVVHPQTQIRKVLDLVKAIPTNEIFATTAEADAYIDAIQRDVLRGRHDDHEPD